MEISSKQGLLKLENRTFLAINQVERKSLISKSNEGSYEFGMYIQRNLDITNLDITKSSVSRTICFFLIDEVLDFIKLLLIAVYRALIIRTSNIASSVLSLTLRKNPGCC